MEKAESSGPPAPVDAADADLVARCQSGDMEAFEILVTRYRGKIFAMILNMIHNEADAWDLSQDTFVRAWQALPKFKGKSSFYTWLYRIGHNVVYDWLRKKSNQTTKIEFDEAVGSDATAMNAPTAPKPPGAPDLAAQRSDLRRALDEALGRLSPEHREVVLLKEVEGLQYQEIAERIDCSIGTVMSRLFYARKKLQELLKNERG